MWGLIGPFCGAAIDVRLQVHGQIARRRKSRTSVSMQIESPEAYAIIAAFETMALCAPDSMSMQANYIGLLEHMGLTVEELQGAVDGLNMARRGGDSGQPGQEPAVRARRTQTPLPQRTGPHFLQDMFETFSELNSGPDGTGGAFLTVAQVTTDTARRMLRARLPQMFEGVGPDGTPALPTVDEVRKALDPEEGGQITVMHFIKAARNMGIIGEKPQAQRDTDHVSPRSGHLCTADSGGELCGKHRVQGGDFCPEHTCSIPGCKRNAMTATTFCEIHTGRSSLLSKSRAPPLWSDSVKVPTAPQYEDNPGADPIFLMFCRLNQEKDDVTLTRDELSSDHSMQFLREQLPQTFNKFDLDDDGIVAIDEIMGKLDSDGNGSVTVLEFLRATKDLRRAEAALADPAAFKGPFGRASIMDSAAGQRGASTGTAAPAAMSMAAGDHLFKVCTAVHMGEGMLSQAELEEELDVAYLAGNLASVLEHFDSDFDGTAEADEILGSLSPGATLVTKDFLQLARQVRTLQEQRVGKGGKAAAKKRKGSGSSKRKKGSPKKAGPPSRHYTPPVTGGGLSILNSGYSTHAI